MLESIGILHKKDNPFGLCRFSLWLWGQNSKESTDCHNSLLILKYKRITLRKGKWENKMRKKDLLSLLTWNPISHLRSITVCIFSVMQSNQRKENYWYILKFQALKARRHQDPCRGINVVWAPCHLHRFVFSSPWLSGRPSWSLTLPASLASLSAWVLPPDSLLLSSLSLPVSWYLPQSPEVVCKGAVGCTVQLLGSSLLNLKTRQGWAWDWSSDHLRAHLAVMHLCN